MKLLIFIQEKKDTEGRIKSKDNSQQLYTRLTLSISGSKGLSLSHPLAPISSLRSSSSHISSPDDSGNIFSSNSPLLQAYDILAVAPSDFKTFQSACALDVDIIVIPPSAYTSYIRHATIKSALDRGTFLLFSFIFLLVFLV
jgi:hypothetical protein